MSNEENEKLNPNNRLYNYHMSFLYQALGKYNMDEIIKKTNKKKKPSFRSAALALEYLLSQMPWITWPLHYLLYP